MDSQNQQPITHTEQPVPPVQCEKPQLPQYGVTLPEVIQLIVVITTLTRASATLTGAITELVRVLLGRRKKK